jgi:site-specific recombinase XerD
MTEQYYTAPRTLERLHSGPLGSHIDGFAALLDEQGYTREVIRSHLRLVADLSHWLDQKELRLRELDEEKVREALGDLPRSRAFIEHHKSMFTLLLEHLRALKLVPTPPPRIDDSALGQLLSEFQRYLLKQRGLTLATVDNYLPPIRRFLSERFGDGPVSLGEIESAEVTHFVVRQARTSGSAQVTVSALRAFLRFLRLRGDLQVDLSAAVPTVARWRLSTLPKAPGQEQVERLLGSCDRSSPMGKRDYAILLLLARLGLRGGEIVGMRLEDLSWPAGELTVRGKGAHYDRLPIPQDVGEALANYLYEGRPKSSSRRVFLRVRAPHRGFASCVTVSSIVDRALSRAGLDIPCRGAHQLRHALATKMLRQGASMAQIGQILRHNHPSATEIYAKVDLAALSELALPWPGGAS